MLHRLMHFNFGYFGGLKRLRYRLQFKAASHVSSQAYVFSRVDHNESL